MKLSPDQQTLLTTCTRPEPASTNARTLFNLQFAAGTTVVTPEDLPEIRAFLSEIYEPRGERAIQRHGVSVTDMTIAGCPALRILPGSGQTTMTMLYFFGGGHITGNPRQDLPITAAFADYGQCDVVSPAYRLAPENPYPAALEDAVAVYTALLATVPAERLVLAGESAGANLTLALLLRIKALGLPMPAKVALLSPWCDLTPENTYGDEPQEFDPTINLGNLYRAARFYAGDSDPFHPEISPVFGAFGPDFPPIIITTGTRDRLLFDVLRLVLSMQSSGLEPTLRIWPDMGHVFEFYDELPEEDLSLRELADFLSSS